MAKAPMTVDAWLAALNDPRKPAVEALRAVIAGSRGDLTERIKWNGPSFCHGGDDRLTIGLDPKGGVRLILHRGVKVRDAAGFRFDDPSGLIKWAAPDRGVISLKDAAAVEAAREPLAGIARRWIDAAA